MARDLYNPLHIFLSSIFLLTFSCKFYVIHAEKIRGMFVFGSSVVDNGNNNNKSIRGNYLPYGIDYPSGPTGRFSNGKNVVDQIADHLSISRIPSFLSLRNNDGSPNINGSEFSNGVNFASGASGIQDDTSLLLGITNLKHQIKNFRRVILQPLEEQLGNGRRNILGDYLFMIAAGDNDYTYYHMLHQDIIWSPLVFAAKLVSNYFDQLKTLYKLGARKFLLMSVYPVGCNPILTHKRGQCIQSLNEAVDLFYEQLLLMVIQSKQDMPDSEFCVVNSAKIILDIIKFPNATGFTNVNSPCCDTTVGGTCKKGGRTCENRKKYVFFDGLHLTEAASDILASKAYFSNEESEAFPDNLQGLIHIK